MTEGTVAPPRAQRRHRAPRVAALTALLVIVAAACGAVDLGALPGAKRSVGADINDQGVVTGLSATPTGVHGFILRPGEAMQDIGTIGTAAAVPEAINSSQVIVGHTEATVNGQVIHRPFRWEAATGMVDMGSLGGPTGEATDINTNGFVVGWSTVAGPSSPSQYRRGWIWDPATQVMTELPLLAGTNESFAAGINDLGQMVGWVYLADGSPHAVMWDAGSGHAATDIGPAGFASEAHAVNASGTASGLIRNGLWSHAAVWEAGTHRVIDLGTLGGNFGCANEINDAGVAVGSDGAGAGSVNGHHAFRWDPATGKMTDLGTLGGKSSHAAGINSAGAIVGWAERADGIPRAVRWDPPKATG